MDNLIKTLPAILAATRASEEVVEAACLGAWKHAVGEVLGNHAVPVQLQSQTLTVVVQDRIWQKQLEQMRGHLLFRLNSVLGETLVQSIEFRVDEERFKEPTPPGDDLRGESVGKMIPIELLSAAAAIEDAGLRRAFLGAAVSCISRSEKSQSKI